MKTPRFYGTPDLMYNWNNGVVFVVPLPQGRFASLVRENERRLCGWCFADHQPDEHPVMRGSSNDGIEFVKTCTDLGLTVAEASNLNVPFSNGPMRRGEHAGHYLPSDYADVRDDLPSRDELTELARVS